MDFKAIFGAAAAAISVAAQAATVYSDTLGPDGQLIAKAAAAPSSSSAISSISDSDRDGLPDGIEVLASRMGLERAYVLNPSNAHSVVQATNSLGRSYSDILVEDYFLRPGGSRLSWGWIFTDHDFCEDDFEDNDSVRALTGETFSRFAYDPWEDGDGDGWCKWSELRAAVRHGDAYPGHPIPTVSVKINFDPRVVDRFNVKAWRGRDTTKRPDAIWKNRTPDRDGRLVVEEADEGYLLEGENIFVVEGLSSGSSEWTGMDPFGFADRVQVGYAAAQCEIDLTGTPPPYRRIKLTGGDGFDQKEERVRIFRMAINEGGVGTAGVVGKPVVFDRIIDIESHPFITESDLLADGAYDLDCGAFSSSATNAFYSIVVGGDSTGTLGNVATNVAFMFENVFESKRTSVCTMSPINRTTVKSATPMFQWSHENSLRKPYPAFRLRIFKDAGNSVKTLVYDSGVRKAPVRDAKGVYRWTPPDLHVDEAMQNGVVFANDANYLWTVDMLDAKFTDVTDLDRVILSEFIMRVDSTGGASSNLGQINVAVKYMGPVPVSVDSASLANLIRVEAFTSPDFAGAPVAATYVKNVDELANPSNAVFNAQLTGVPVSDSLYVRAFIDTDGSRTNAYWKTWGYGNYVGTDRKDVYTPRAYTNKLGSVKMPTAIVYLEDVDNNGNGLMDALEFNSIDGLRNEIKNPCKSAEIAIDLRVDGNGNKSLVCTNIFQALSGGKQYLPALGHLSRLRNGGVSDSLKLAYAMADLEQTGDSLAPDVYVSAFGRESFELDVGYPSYVNPVTLVPYGNSDGPVSATISIEYRSKTGEGWTTRSIGTYEILPSGPSASLRARLEDDVVNAVRGLTNVQYRVKIDY